ncbi:thioredoxin domain-containing protein [Streptomyces sp. NPDC089799]|uniref:DsbA family protein n=1 Tax=Streptomyces sp. NPDC089799 TaxID=3155066 RepID=UPI00343D741D
MPRPGTPASKKSPKPLLISAGVVLVAVAMGLVSWQATAPEQKDEGWFAYRELPSSAGSSKEPGRTGGTGDAPRADLLALARRDAGDQLAVGRADAPVVLIEYADYRCGYCGKFARDSEPGLIATYVEKGTLRIEYRNFPIFGEESEAAARAAWAAGRQGRFHAFHSAAYAKGVKEKGFGADRLAELARQAGVADLERFKADMDGTAAREAVGRDQEEGHRIGVSSTPSFLVNGEPIAGALPPAEFEEAIERAAAKAAR